MEAKHNGLSVTNLKIFLAFEQGSLYRRIYFLPREIQSLLGGGNGGVGGDGGGW